MEAIIPLLRETRKARDAELSRQENQQTLEYNAHRRELKKIAEQTRECVETIEKNLHNITGHKHAISKVVHESKQCSGLPVSNKHHKQTLDFINDVITVLNNAEELYAKPDSENNSDTCYLSSNVDFCSSNLAKKIWQTQWKKQLRCIPTMQTSTSSLITKLTRRFIHSIWILVNKRYLRNCHGTALLTGFGMKVLRLHEFQQTCAESTSTVFKGTKSSVEKVETLMENMHIILEPYMEDEPDLERSIFDE